MKIVAIDPGTEHVGVACLTLDGKNITITEVHTLNRPKKLLVGVFFHRVTSFLYQRCFEAQTVACEDTYCGRFTKNGRTVINPHAQQMLERCIGVVQMAAALHGCDFRQIRATEWKRLAAGNGQAKWELVRLCLTQNATCDLKEASEHAICAAGIGYAVATRILHGE